MEIHKISFFYGYGFQIIFLSIFVIFGCSAINICNKVIIFTFILVFAIFKSFTSFYQLFNNIINPLTSLIVQIASIIIQSIKFYLIFKNFRQDCFVNIFNIIKSTFVISHSGKNFNFCCRFSDENGCIFYLLSLAHFFSVLIIVDDFIKIKYRIRSVKIALLKKSVRFLLPLSNFAV